MAGASIVVVLMGAAEVPKDQPGAPEAASEAVATANDGGEGDANRPPRPVWGPTRLLGEEVLAGDKRRLFLRSSESFAGGSVRIPVLVIRGQQPGQTFCLTAGIHGDELNGIEVVRKVFEMTVSDDLHGMLIGMPVVNLHGFCRGSRYLPDRRDLNRFFPGHPRGSSASRIANAVFVEVIQHCDALLDLHSGSFHRTNLPQIRADLNADHLLALARGFGVVVVHSLGMPGTLRRAAGDVGIPAVTYEAGEPMRFERGEIDRGVRGVYNLMADLGMLEGRRGDRKGQRVYYRSSWVRVNDGGIFITDQDLGDRVDAGEVLGSVTDPVSNDRAEVLAPFSGRIIGMAVSQVVIPGFAAFHIGIDTGPPVDETMGSVEGMGAPTGGAPPDQLDAEEHPE